MIYHVQFPKLGLEFTVPRVAFSVGNVAVYWYGICIAVGLVLAVAFAVRQARSYGINADRMLDVVMVSTLCAIVCARAFYVIFAPFSYTSFWEIINLRDGGIAIYGGIIGAFLAGWAMCRWRKVPVLAQFDLAALGFLIGQGIGRWGNFFNQEAFGTNTQLPWGMYSEGTYNYLEAVQAFLASEGVYVDPSQPVHPTFLYESVWCLLGFVLLWCYSKRRKFHGEIFLLYLVWYGAERFVVEGLRTDSLETLLGIRVSQLIALVSVVVAGGLWIWQHKKHKGQPLLVVYPVVDKRLHGPAVICWALGQTPTEAQLKQQIDDLVAQQDAAEQELQAQAEDVAEKEPQVQAEETPAQEPLSDAQPDTQSDDKKDDDPKAE